MIDYKQTLKYMQFLLTTRTTCMDQHVVIIKENTETHNNVTSLGER